MAYAGTTSTAANPPVLVTQGMTSGVLPRQWIYKSTHISSDIEAVNFFTDGQALGMAVGDQLIHVGSTTYVMTSHTVIAVGATTTDLGVGTTIGLAT